MNSDTDLRKALRACRGAGLFLVAFSVAINILALASPIYMMQLYDRVMSSRSMDTLVMLSLIFALAVGALVVIEGLRSLALSRMGVWLDDRLGPPVILAGLRTTVTGSGSGRAGQALRDLATLRGFLSGPTTVPLMDAPWAPWYLGFLFVLHPLLGIIGLVSGLVLLGLALVNEAVTKRPLQEANTAAAKSMHALDAAFRNAEAIAAMDMQDGVLRIWRRAGLVGKDAQRVAGHRAAAIQTLSKFTRLLVQSGIMGIGAWLVIENRASPGVLFGASFLIARALAPVDNAITTWRSVVSARFAYRNLQRLLESSPPVVKGMPLPAPRGNITVERLVYAPPGAESPTLRGISFSLRAGEVMGLIGPSAAGKTTLARCLTGAWLPASGNVRMDGADIAAWHASGGGEHIGYLPQDVELFAGTIRDNIARLRDASPTAIIDAAKLVGLHDTIMRLPNCYDSDIGESGVKLSGGQRQRLGLARALFGEPKLVVLDEPNASLDSEGEAALIEAIARLKARGATVIVIAHRPNILQHADKILMLRGGMVEMFGPRSEIMPTLSTGPKVAPLAPVATMTERVHAEFASGSGAIPMRPTAVGEQGQSA
jgi:PrtD family type I secretion system ABC transporter